MLHTLKVTESTVKLNIVRAENGCRLLNRQLPLYSRHPSSDVYSTNWDAKQLT